MRLRHTAALVAMAGVVPASAQITHHLGDLRALQEEEGPAIGDSSMSYYSFSMASEEFAAVVGAKSSKATGTKGSKASAAKSSSKSTPTPTESPTQNPTESPTKNPTKVPSNNPTEEVAAPPRSAEEISALTSSVKTVFSHEDINGILPHRYPFLLVDKVVEYEMGKRAVGIKSVTLNEPHFTGYFPDRPIMPGVLQVEALAQLASIVLLQIDGVEPGAVFFFAGVDGVKWKKPVVPGDSLVMEVEIKKWNKRFGIATATGRAYVDGEMAVELDEMKFALAK